MPFLRRHDRVVGWPGWAGALPVAWAEAGTPTTDATPLNFRCPTCCLTINIWTVGQTDEELLIIKMRWGLTMESLIKYI